MTRRAGNTVKMIVMATSIPGHRQRVAQSESVRETEEVKAEMEVTLT